MGRSHGFRPPQFSEDAAWLPTWLQQCDFETFGVEGGEKEHVCFEQRIEELQIFGTNLNNAESSREYGGCKISQLFLSGADTSPSSFAQSADNVAIYNFHLSSDGNSENSTPVTDVVETESNCNFVMLPLADSKILGREAISPRLFHHSGALESSPKVELHGHPNQDGLLKCRENVIFSEYFVDTVELCIAASETLVINEVIKNDSSVKPSISATLEASVQMKQARLEACENALCCSLDKVSDIDNLSDLDDIAMGSAYEDTGIHLDELHLIELNVSQVKDTLDSEYDEKTVVSAADCGTNDDSSTHDMKGGVANDTQLTNNLAVECFDGDTKKKVTENLAFGLGFEEMGLYSDCLEHIQASEEIADTVTYENNLLETNVGSSLNKRFHKTGKDHNSLHKIQDRFQSRWFGGWTWKIFAKPFVDETSFFSESVDVAPDENSFLQNHDKGTIITSQLSVPSESFADRAMGGITLSQDVKSSSASFLDPLCSVVPCSVSENICPLPATSQDDEVLPRHYNITTDNTKGNLSGPSASNSNLPQGEGTAMQISNIKKPQDAVYRRFTSLRNYSTLVSGGATFLEKDSHQKTSLWIDSNNELIFQEASFANCEHIVKDGVEPLEEKNSHFPPVVNYMTHYHQADDEENQSCSHAALWKDSVKLPTSEVPKCELLKCKSRPASKHVHFSEKKIDIHHKLVRKVHSTPKTCLPTKAAKKLTRSGYHGSGYLNIFRKNHLVKKKMLIFRSMEFMLTGFSCPKEKEIEGLIRKHGGTVVTHIPSTNLKGKRSSRLKSQVLPIIICLMKMQSIKFLYGCAVNAFILRVNWLMDSVAAGFILPKEKYMILSRNIGGWHSQENAVVRYDIRSLIFNNVGIMLHGKSKMFADISTIIKHGGGQVFNTLQRLIQNLEVGRISIGVVVAEDENHASRHLKQCALENNVSMTSIYWIISSLHAGQLIPLKEKRKFKCLPAIKIQRLHDPMELSPEI
ncbi:uncharacterized protein LOC142553743 isoform X2 [Primulina tabacum]|uniref:uncharacterized protein LOC142553743 isoform X2 n=1 Tax=Primulina tabacum TaxID=48773 RepID=UPI003F5A3BBC